MNLTQIYLDTFQTEYPKILNGNFASISRYVDMFYDGSLGILTKPLTTTGRVKGARGEFVTVIVDNLVVKNQFTNLFDNNTTADYNFYKLYIDPAIQPRDPCLGPFRIPRDTWPMEFTGNKYIDVNQPYYKIQNISDYYVLNNNNLSQVVGIFLDPSLVDPNNQFKVILNPVTGANFTVDATGAGDPSMGTGFYVEFIMVSYDASFGATWAQYKHGLPIVGTGGGGGGIGGAGTAGFLPIFNSGSTITDSFLSMSGSTLNTFDIDVDGIISLTNKQIKGVATPTDPSDAVNLDYTNKFATNASVNGTFVPNASLGSTFVWDAGILDVCTGIIPVSQAYVDGSLATRDACISTKFDKISIGPYATNASIGLAGFATNASINLAGFAKNASLGLYATNASVNAAGFATNSSVNLAGFAKNASLGLYATNSSINAAGFATNASVGLALGAYATNASVNAAGFITSSALGPYATNASVGLALGPYATNASVGLALGPYATNASVGIALGDYATNSSINIAGFATNASIATAGFVNSSILALYILSASTGYGLYWDASGLLDVSIAGVTDAATNASLYYELGLRDVSIAWLDANKLGPADLAAYLTPYATITYVDGTFVTNVSVNNAFFNYYTSAQVDALLLGYVTQAYVDGSLNLQQLQIDSLDNRVTILENSTGHVDFAYVDGSLFTRDSSIILLFNRLFSTDTSLNSLTLEVSTLDSSLFAMNSSLGDFATNASVNLAGFAKNSSVNFLYGWQLSQDASIGLIIGTNATQSSQITVLQGRVTGTETSIAYLNLHSVKDISLSDDFAWVGGLLEVSIAAVTDAATNASLYYELSVRDVEIATLQFDKADITYVDGSLAQYILSASIGYGLYWDASGFLDVSVVGGGGGVSQAYVDGSLSALNASVNAALFTTNASFGAYATNASVNLALTNYATNSAVILALYPYATNASVNAALFTTNSSFGAYATNSSINTAAFAKNASLGLYATNASVGLALGPYATNASVGLALGPYATNSSVNIQINQLNASIARIDASLNDTVDLSILVADFATNASVNLALGAYATNSSVGIALYPYATNSSIGTFKTIYIDPSLNAKLNLTGGTITGQMFFNDGFQVNSGDVSILLGDVDIAQHLHVHGNFEVDGSFIYTNVDAINVSTGFLLLNTGLVGSPPITTQSGIVVARGTEDPYIFVFDENTQTFRIGISHLDTSIHYLDSSTQAVATREDSPVNGGLAYWNASEFRFDTSTAFSPFNFVLKTGDEMSGGLIIDGSLTTEYIFAHNGDPSSQFGKTLRIKAGNSDPSSSIGGAIYAIGGDNNSTIPGPGGEIYISPGKQYSSGGDYVARVFIGNSEYNSSAIAIHTEGALSNVSLDIQQKGNGALTLGTQTGTIYMYGTQLAFSGTESQLYFYPAQAKLYFSSSDGTIQGAQGFATGKGYDLKVAGGPAYGYSSTHGDGGKLILLGGAADSSAAPNNGGSIVIGGGQGINGGVDGSIYIFSLKDVSSSKILFFNPDTSTISYSDQTGGAGVTSLYALTDVSIVDVSNNHFLTYDSSIGKWKNVAPLDASNYFQRRIENNTIPSSIYSGNSGDWSYDSSYLYICTSTNKWGRILLDASF